MLPPPSPRARVSAFKITEPLSFWPLHTATPADGGVGVIRVRRLPTWTARKAGTTLWLSEASAPLSQKAREDKQTRQGGGGEC